MDVEISKGVQLYGIKLEASDFNRDGSAFYAYFSGFPGTNVEEWKLKIKALIREGGFGLGINDEDFQLTLAKDFLWEHRYYLGSCG